MIQYQKRELTVFQSTLYQTTTAIIKTKDAIILTDPNWLPSEIKAIQHFINKNLGNRQLYIIFTHSDFDHIIAAGAFPHAKTIASRAFAEREDKERIQNEIRQFDSQYYIIRDYPIIYPKIDIIIERDSQQLMVGDYCLTFYLAPGHTNDGLMTVIEPLEILLAGDYLSDVEFPFLSDVKAYEDTLNKVRKIVDHHNITTLVPGHGQTTNVLDEILIRIEQASEYINHLKNNVDQQHVLKQRYMFYKGLEPMHEANIQLIKK